MALQLARRGWRVAFTGRRKARLEETARAAREAGGEPLALQGSVSDPADVRRHYAAVKEAWGGLDWAILKRRGGLHGRQGVRAEAYRWTFDVNVLGMARWLEAVIPTWSPPARTIAGVSSLAAFRGLPTSGPYCASKAAVSAMLESARVDLAGTGSRS